MKVIIKKNDDRHGYWKFTASDVRALAIDNETNYG
jgi:hypothetical protein